jgi:hypothetical protein
MKRLTNKDTAVYWEKGTPITGGTYTFATPVDIKCFWKESEELIRDNEGREAVSRAQVFVAQSLDSEGTLYHGSLADLTTAQKADPRTVKDAYEIKRFEKIPSIVKSDELVYKAYL